MKQDNNKKIAIMQPYFFPYIGYWQLINTVDEFIIFDDVNYIKRGWINRNYVLLNGKKYRIGLNIKDVSQNRLIKDTYLAQSYKDTNKLLASIFHAYNKASYFYDVYPILEKILNTKSNRIVDVLTKQIEEVCKYLKIKTKIICSSTLSNDKEKHGEQKIIDICKKQNAKYYINAIGGRELYREENFKENGLILKFLQTENIDYQQLGNYDFQANLSIIDVMMCNAPDKIAQMLNKYNII